MIESNCPAALFGTLSDAKYFSSFEDHIQDELWQC